MYVGHAAWNTKDFTSFYIIKSDIFTNTYCNLLKNNKVWVKLGPSFGAR